MHIPDNYLSPTTCAVMGAMMIPIWTRSVKKVKKEVTKEKMPLMGIGAAFSFLVMMFNVPFPGGTTGHAVGATLVALLLGPEAACISVTIALLIQALMFADGGILSFGANCFNMAFIIPFSGYYICRFIKGRVKTEKGEYAAILIGSYIAINIAAMFAAIEFGIQPLLFKDALGMPLYCPYSLAVSIPAMVIPHLLVVGVLEGIVTAGVYGFIKNVSPGIIYEGSKAKFNRIYALIFAMICLSPLGLLATGTAWGEWGSDEINSVVSGGKALGFVPKAIKKLRDSMFSKTFHKKIGFVFQNSEVQLFCSNVYDEIAFGVRQMGMLEEDVNRRVNDILELLKINELKDRQPYHLSGGEKRKVAVACVLVMNPNILVFDEPMNGLDPKTKTFLKDLMIKLNKSGKTILCSTHDFDYVKGIFKRAVVFSNKNTIIRDGDYCEIMSDTQFLLDNNII